ncbi:MAG TPA: ATP-binding protein [Pseudonocardiaceae bacterium]|nr:ATP-binding protein [Pseudonocardiaceae bacterium]
MASVECGHHSVPLPNAKPPPLRAVRALVSNLTADLPPELGEDLLLVVTELVANAYEHGTAPRSLRLRRDDSSHVVVEVDDAAPNPPVVGHSRLDGNRGRGLTIVSALAERWGVRALRAGKTVWARLQVAQPAG